ncbi:MAG TPA: hypothetical protein ENN39_10355 [Desulfonatronum sp.]|nr:hypothetical protein [Desulfonatronum sp.]
MGFWERFFKRRTHDQASADRQVRHSRTGKGEGPDTKLDSHVVHDDHERYDGHEPMYMRKNRTEPFRPGGDLDDAVLPDGPSSCAPNRQVKGALSFVLPDDRQAELMALCAQLNTHRSEVIRACLEMGMPLFKSHPDLYEYFRQRSRRGW